jgi:hypothetical protein
VQPTARLDLARAVKKASAAREPGVVREEPETQVWREEDP